MRVLITGASRGIGLELARQCAARGDRVLAGARDPSRAPALAGDVTWLPLDVADPASIAKARASVSAGASIDGLELLVNNAGASSGSPGAASREQTRTLGQLTADALDRLFRVNAIGPILVTQAFADLLARGATVLNVSTGLASIAAKTGGGNYGYCGSKAALNMMTRALAADLAPRGVKVVAVNPGWVKTDMGGPSAPVTPTESVAGMLALVAGLQPRDSGGFRDWQGHTVDW